MLIYIIAQFRYLNFFTPTYFKETLEAPIVLNIIKFHHYLPKAIYV